VILTYDGINEAVRGLNRSREKRVSAYKILSYSVDALERLKPQVQSYLANDSR
jgi:hypothetical protein